MTKSVLITDDEPNLLLSLKFLMKESGFDDVRTASDGEATLNEVVKQAPDLLLLDIDIPKRNGYDVCQTVRALPHCKDMKIVMLSAKDRQTEPEKGLALGADDYITKPFSIDTLANAVKAVMGDPG